MAKLPAATSACPDLDLYWEKRNSCHGLDLRPPSQCHRDLGYIDPPVSSGNRNRLGGYDFYRWVLDSSCPTEY